MIPSRSTGALVVALLTLSCADAAERSPPFFDTAGAEPAVAERLETLRQSAVAAPEDAAVWGRLALSLHAHGYPDAALETYRIARSIEPGEFAYLYLPAGILVPRGDPGAEALLESAFELRPDYAPLRLMLAQWRLDHGDPGATADLIENSAAMRETPAHANLLLARARLATGDTALAREYLDEAIAVAPRFSSAHALLGSLARASGDSAAAELAGHRVRLYGDPPVEDSFQALLAAEGVSSRWHILKGQALLTAGSPGAAIEEFRVAQNLLPKDGFVARQLGLALSGAGRLEEAAAAFRRALELTPGLSDARLDLAGTLFSLGRVEEALDEVQSAVEETPASSDAWLTYAMFEQARGRYRAAAGLLARALQQVDFDPRIALRLAWILATTPDDGLRDGGQAVALAEAANRIEDYMEPASLDVLAAAYAEYGDFPRAIAAGERAAALAAGAGADDLASTIRGHLARLRGGRPIRE